MAKKRISRKGSVAIDTVPLPERPEKWIKMPTKKGRVSASRGKYFLTIGRRRIELPGCPGGPIKEFRKLVGKEVHAAVSGSSIAAIGVLPKIIRRRRIPCYWILCYLPAPDILMKIRPEIRKKLISEMVRERVISTQLARELRRGL